MTTREKFETIEDMVKWTMHPYNASRRWMLEDTTHQEYVNPELGAAWDDEFLSVHHDSPDYAEYEAALRARRPQMVDVTYWSLCEADGNARIELAPALGAMLNGIWKTKPAWPGSRATKRVGNMTVQGMLKRLGVDVADEVEAAIAKAERAEGVNNRNSVRREVARKAGEIMEIIKRHPEIEWPAELAALLDPKLEE
jgi:hypothetical protein